MSTYEVRGIFDDTFKGTLETGDGEVVTYWDPEDGYPADMFEEEIQGRETIYEVAGHWRTSKFVDTDSGQSISDINTPGASVTLRHRHSNLEELASRAGGQDVSKAEEGGGEVELTGTGVISKADEERRIVYGWAYVTHDREGNVVVDKSGDFVDAIDEIDKAAVQFMLDSRSTDAHHTNVKTGTVVESMVFTPEKIEKMGLPPGVLPSGWWIGTKVDEATWRAYKQGRLTSFSVHGRGVRKAVG